jgi:hypothetical protein
VFDVDLWAGDMIRASAAAREVAARRWGALDSQGVQIDQLRPCDPEAPDGTSLPHCVKVCLPTAGGSTWHGAGHQPARGPLRARLPRIRTPTPGTRCAAGGLTRYFRISLNSASIRERRIDRRRVSASSLT